MTKRTLWITVGLILMLILVLQGCGGGAAPVTEAPPASSEPAPESTTPAAYTEISVTDGGNIRGVVTFEGTPPPQGTIAVTKDNDIFGDTVPDETLMVSVGGGIKNAVIFIDVIKEGKPIPDTVAVIGNKGALFTPHVQVFARQEWLLRNEDPVLHNIHPYLGVKGAGGLSLYNVALSPGEGGAAKEITRPLRRGPGLHNIRCDSHKWMVAWAWVLEHPYGIVTGEDGSFVIDDIPPGTYKLKVWHETLGEQDAEITITAGGTTEVDFELSL